MRSAIGGYHAERINIGLASLVEENHVPRILHDLSWRAHARNSKRLAVQSSVVVVRIFVQDLDLLFQFRFVWRLIGSGCPLRAVLGISLGEIRIGLGK